MQPSMLAKRVWVLVFLGIAGFYLWGLGSLPLVGPDEPRYAEVAREMYARHDLITPTLGGLPWFEKPPLLYWLIMASYRFAGVNEYAARVAPALCGLLTAVAVFGIGKTVEVYVPGGRDKELEQIRHGLGQYSALVWLSSLGAIAFSRGASFDAVVTLTVTAAFACFFVWHVRRGNDRGSDGVDQVQDKFGQKVFLPGFYLFIGLSFLAKGLIGFVIPFGVVAIYFLIRREFPGKKFVRSLLWGVPLSIAIAAAWFGPMASRHGWVFIDQFIIQQHFARFVTNKYHHPGPIYFYLPVLVAFALPWTIFLVASLLSSRGWAWRGETSVDRLRVFAFAWVIVPILFFSLSGSKLTAYILPALPGVALLVGERITCFAQAHRGDKVLRLTGALWLSLAATGGYDLVNSGVGPYCIGAAALPFVLVGAASLVRPQMRKALLVVFAAAMLTTTAIALKCAAPIIARKESVRDLLAAASSRGYGAVPVVQMHTVERTAEFYAADRMNYGSDGEPIKLEGVMPVVEAARRNGGVVLCFVPLEFQSQLTSYPQAQTEVIADNGRVALIVLKVR